MQVVKWWRTGHGVVLAVVAQLLRDGGITKEECQAGKHVLARIT
jgi:hypothetical protein